MVTAELYILYGFLAFICLLLIAILGMLYRQGRAIGRLEGQFDGLNGRINGLTARIERLEEQMANLREQVAEVRGLLVSLHERVDLLMRHRHDDAAASSSLPKKSPQIEHADARQLCHNLDDPVKLVWLS